MPTKTYGINFKVSPGQALADIKALKAALIDLDKTYTKVEASARAFSAKAAGGFKAVEAAARQAGVAVNGMGGHKAAFDVLDADLKSAKRNLDGVRTSASGASRAVGGVGGGMGGGVGVGGGGKAGVPRTSGVGGVLAAAGDLKTAVAGVAVVGGIKKTVNAISGTVSNQSDQTREYFGTAAEKAAQWQQDMRSYASLVGEKGVTPEIARRVFSFAQEAGVSVDEAGKFLDRFEGSGQLGIQKGNLGGKVGENGFTQADQDRLKTDITRVGSQFGNRVGIQPDIAADITAFIPQLNKVTTPEQFAGILGGAHYGIDEGKGDMGTLARATIASAATSVPSGRLSGIPEAAAWIGVLSGVVGKEGQVDERYNQINRFLGTSGKEGGSEYLRSIGAGKASGNLAKLQLVAKDVKASGVKNVGAYLQSKGFTATEEVSAVEAILPEMDTLTSRVATANSFTSRGGEVLAKNAANQEMENVTRRRDKAALESNQIQQGLIQQSSQDALVAAEARLRKPLPGGGDAITNRTLGQRFSGYAANWAGWLGGAGDVDPEQIMIQHEAIRGMFEEGKEVGIDIPQINEGMSHAFGGNDVMKPQDFQREYSRGRMLIDAEKARRSNIAKAGAGGGGPAAALRRVEQAAGDAANELERDAGGSGEASEPVGPIRR